MWIYRYSLIKALLPWNQLLRLFFLINYFGLLWGWIVHHLSWEVSVLITKLTTLKLFLQHLLIWTLWFLLIILTLFQKLSQNTEFWSFFFHLLFLVGGIIIEFFPHSLWGHPYSTGWVTHMCIGPLLTI